MIAFGFALTDIVITGVGTQPPPPLPTGTGTLNFSIVTGDNTALLALLEDI